MTPWMGVLIFSFIVGCSGSNGGLAISNGRGPVPERADPTYPSAMEASEDNPTGSPTQQDPTGTEDTPDTSNPLTGSNHCTNSSDQAANAALEGNEDEDFDDCARDCFTSETDDFSGCYGECLVEHRGCSQNCAICLSDFITCNLENCMGCDDEEECDRCTAENCTPAFEECSGVSSPW